MSFSKRAHYKKNEYFMQYVKKYFRKKSYEKESLSFLCIATVSNRELFVRLLICLSFAGLLLYKYIDKLNGLTELRLSIPLLERELKDIQEENLERQYAIDCFESPLHLMELARKPEFGHLKYPSIDTIILLPEARLEEDSPD